ncbi:MAG TPA: hypothetical protein VLN47_00610, partial [Clostridiaceae bacterium]|nr:hypothetical protein [Clostridiaceae bacterium]
STLDATAESDLQDLPVSGLRKWKTRRLSQKTTAHANPLRVPSSTCEIGMTSVHGKEVAEGSFSFRRYCNHIVTIFLFYSDQIPNSLKRWMPLSEGLS